MTSKILISRVDGLGDVTLTLPLIGILKKYTHYKSIYFLAQNYTIQLLDGFLPKSNILNWNSIQQLSKKEQITLFKNFNFEVVIHVFPQKSIAKIMYDIQVPIRIGTSHRLYHWIYCNKRINFSRKRSFLHESELNTLLLKPLLLETFKHFLGENFNFENLIKFIPRYKNLKLSSSKGLEMLDIKINTGNKKSKIYVMIHPKSKGSAVEWDWLHYKQLILLLPKKKFHFFITGTSSEEKDIQVPQEANVTNLMGKLNLKELIYLIQKVDYAIACSTGPLHIAGIFNTKIIGFYLNKPPIFSKRWKPLNKDAIILEDDDNINNITPSQVLKIFKNL